MKRHLLILGVCLIAARADAFCIDAADAGVHGFDCDSEPGVCRGTFDLADPGSRDSFEALTQKLATCTDVPPVRDQGVNHPDFYDAWAFIIDGAPVTLSIKDKTALGKTFVVLRGSMSEMRRN